MKNEIIDFPRLKLRLDRFILQLGDNLCTRKRLREYEVDLSLYRDICASTAFLPENSTLKNRVVAVQLQLTEIKKCRECGTPLAFNVAKSCYPQYCRKHWLRPGRSAYFSHTEPS